LLAHALAGVALLCHIVSIDNTHSRYNFLECHPALRSRVEECEAFIWCCSCPPSAFCRRPAGARRRKAPAFAKTTRFELKVTNLNEIAQTLAALEASQFLIVISSPNAAQSKYLGEEARRFKMLGRAAHPRHCCAAIFQTGLGQLGVKNRSYRAATSMPASPQSADMPRQAPSPIAECAMRQSRRRGRTAPSAHARSDDNYQGNRHNHCDGVDHASLHPLTV
jgi:hypothetical protein